MKTIDQIWLKRKKTLDKLYFDTKWLIRCNRPLRQKMGIWQSFFDKFVNESFEQDQRIRELIED